MLPPDGASREAPRQAAGEDSVYQQSWPMMVEEAPARKRGKGILFLLLLLVMVGSAAVAFVIFKDRFFGSGRASQGRGSDASTNRSVAAAQPAKPPDPQGPQTSAGAQPGMKPVPSPSVSTAAASSTPTPASVASGDSGKTGQPADAVPPPGGKLVSLQVASFPNEGSAKQFQEKLVQAGLPAYVVAADIPHRGRWYRVRAGKFAGQDEARQAAESWRKRAAAAGINLQFVPCDYQ